jgi:hypothetical protein
MELDVDACNQIHGMYSRLVMYCIVSVNLGWMIDLDLAIAD